MKTSYSKRFIEFYKFNSINKLSYVLKYYDETVEIFKGTYRCIFYEREGKNSKFMLKKYFYFLEKKPNTVYKRSHLSSGHTI